MAAIKYTDYVKDAMRQVLPRSGFPVQNMGGLPRAGTAAPARPFITSPTVKAGPPGPAAGGGVVPRFQPTPPGGVVVGASPGGRPAPPLTRLPQPPLAAAAPAPAAPPVGALSPAPAPAAPPPGAPTPTPAPPPGSSTTTASSGQTGVLSQPAQGDLEGQIRDYLSGAFKGSVTPEFIQRAKDQVFRNVSGQTRQASNRVNEDAIRRGLYRSGIPAEGIANVEAAGQGAMASGVADILNSAEAQNIQGRQAAAGTAGSLLSANRTWQQYQDQKAAADAARRAAGAPKTFEYIDPDTGQSYQMDESWF